MTLDKNDFFRHATIRICGSLNIEKALWQLFRYLEKFMPVTGMNLHVFESGLTKLRTIAQATLDETTKMPQDVSLPKEITSELKHGWMEKSDVTVCNRPELDPFMRSMTRLFGHPERSVMVMRLEIEGNKIGALTLYADGIDQYNGDHGSLISMLHDPIAIAMSNAFKHEEVLKFKDLLRDDNKYLNHELHRLSGDEIIGKDGGLRGVMGMVRQVAPLDSPVLLLGETGVGKEVIANAIHYSSPRKDGPFIKVNCGAIPESLMDSELFGHEKGAFTGAIAKRRGRFERAHKGTIFLDEIGDLPPAAQTRLLRVLQYKEIERVGGVDAINVDIRIIVATHRNLEQMVDFKQFREDLWFRLNIFPIIIPPLRGRKEDIPALAHHFIERKSKEMKFNTVPTLDSGTIDQLKSYNWPGNVRELENVVERILIKNRGQSRNGPLQLHQVATTQGKDLSPLSGHDYDFHSLNKTISLHIQRALDQTKGKVCGPGGAAELLEINPNTLKSKMKKLGIQAKRQ